MPVGPVSQTEQDDVWFLFLQLTQAPTNKLAFHTVSMNSLLARLAVYPFDLDNR
jgi:hypothetical protein